MRSRRLSRDLRNAGRYDSPAGRMRHTARCSGEIGRGAGCTPCGAGAGSREACRPQERQLRRSGVPVDAGLTPSIESGVDRAPYLAGPSRGSDHQVVRPIGHRILGGHAPPRSRRSHPSLGQRLLGRHVRMSHPSTGIDRFHVFQS